jgi:putative endonuclease
VGNKTQSRWFVYVLECLNGKLYTGISTDVDARFHAHRTGKGAMFTRLNKPSHLLGLVECAGRSEASRMEIAIKKMTAAKKRVLAASWLRREDTHSK